MNWLSKIYSMVLLLGSISCFGSEDAVTLHTKEKVSRPYMALYLDSIITTYKLVNHTSSECARGYGIIQVGTCYRDGFSGRCDDTTYYFIVYDPNQLTMNNTDDRLSRYRYCLECCLNRRHDKDLVKFETLPEVQQAVEQGRIPEPSRVPRAGATRLPAVDEAIPNTATLTCCGSCVIS